MTTQREDDVHNENVGQEEAMLKEFCDEHATIAVNIQNMLMEFEDILGETRKKQWEEVIADQSKKVKHHSKKIKAKVQQIAPRLAISSYESEMLQIQKATVEAQRKLVHLESRNQDKERKEGKALVCSKVLEFKDKVKALESHIQIV